MMVFLRIPCPVGSVRNDRPLHLEFLPLDLLVCGFAASGVRCFAETGCTHHDRVACNPGSACMNQLGCFWWCVVVFRGSSSRVNTAGSIAGSSISCFSLKRTRQPAEPRRAGVKHTPGGGLLFHVPDPFRIVPFRCVSQRNSNDHGSAVKQGVFSTSLELSLTHVRASVAPTWLERPV